MMSLINGLLTALLLIIFVAVWVWAWSSRNKKKFDEMANLPLREQPNGNEEERND